MNGQILIKWKQHLWARPRPLESGHIESLEATWNIKLPIQYKHILVHNQGMAPEPGVFTIEQDTKVVDLFLAVDLERDHETYSVVSAHERLRPHIAGQFFPFAMTHGGEILCFDYREPQLEPGVILVTKEMSIHRVATSFQRFLENLHEPRIKDIYDTVLHWPPQDVEAWLDTVAVGDLVEGARFNWEVFAFTTARYATETPSLPWARVSLRVYRGLVASSPEEDYVNSLMRSTMNLRACMIIEFGPKEGDPVLDPELIMTWFKQTTTLPFEEAASWAASKDFYNIPVDKILRLRRIKSALNVVELIMGVTDIRQKHPDLHRWLRLKSDLP